MPPSIYPERMSIAIMGGLVAGALDIGYAWLFWTIKAAVPVERILQSVAAGVLGARSFDGGVKSAALGVALHFGMTVAMSLAYFLAARRLSSLRRWPLACGAAYGLILYGAMHYVVLPLSAAGAGPRDSLWIGLSVAMHMLIVGIPIALFARLALNER